jgi:hypothetical protein
MRKNHSPLLAVSLLALCLMLGCAGVSARFDQTGVNLSLAMRRQIVRVDYPVRQYLVFISETGEMLHADQIMAREQCPKDTVDIALAKLDGYYFIAGDGFRNVWQVTPAVPNRARLKALALPDTTGIAGKPQMELKPGSADSYLLALTGKYRSGKSFSLTINNQGKVVSNEK